MTDYRAALKATDPEIYETLIGEERRQREGVEMIPSENYTFPEVYAALGSAFTNKYAEGYPGRRYYGGTEFVDVMENLARDRAKEIFRAEHANVQPLSGSPMNQAVYLGFIEPGATILAMDSATAATSRTARRFRTWARSIASCATRRTRKTAPSISTNCATWRGRKSRSSSSAAIPPTRATTTTSCSSRSPTKSARSTMADVSHIGGLIAGGVMRNPMDAGFDFMTTTTHKSLRGPRGGMILCKKDHAKGIDQSVFPGLQGGPHMNQVAATAVTLKLAAQPAFKTYAAQVLKNAKALATELIERGRAPRHRRHRQPSARHRRGQELRHQRRDRRKGARPRRHDDEQASHPRRSEPAAAPLGRAPGHAGGDHARHEGRRDETNRPHHGRGDEKLRRSRNAWKACAKKRA